ncbi:deoxyribodipyrimidine photolyase [Marinomonas sp. A3A]|uniref:FAD-binding domain-containing protein n=1 Tax=Marinomonas sp. A3A TaxID=2065312 RepID=UPI001BB327FD|nr:FAD-binding domain-containing protein [Marinomonas sp. A3A]QUX93351.1 deoxyribodipyrimidine photolyase [Marinomonas sp. A3A]
MNLQVVWFKRDLRVVDHEALSRASLLGPVLCFYQVEHEYWQLPDTSNRQWLFIRESLFDLAEQLQNIGGRLVLFEGNVEVALKQILCNFGHFTLHSHEEIGNLWTFERDQKVARWCRQEHVDWREYAQFGVVRPISKRKSRFKAHWDEWISRPPSTVSDNPYFINAELPSELKLSNLPTLVTYDELDCPLRQLGGRTNGLLILESFLNHRSERYRGSISSPLTAESGCSRLSPYLANGCLSLREIANAVLLAQKKVQNSFWKKSLHDYYTRLWWHCYFIQTFESNHHMEHVALTSAMEKLDRPFDADKFEAWRMGRTGWPMVDACMRCLHAHGWINFRMRAMLVSVATFSLSLPWRPVAEWLAKLFVDFEPGIHYPQIQMHSGMSGNKTLRIYNPVNQAFDLDRSGIFVKRWIPELRDISHTWIFEPWKSKGYLKTGIKSEGGSFYPAPLVDFEIVHRTAKAKITELRAQHNIIAAKGFNEQNQKRSRSSSKSSRKRKTNDNEEGNQLSLF